MRGKRAFVIITIHLLLVAGFAWMVETLIGADADRRLRRHVHAPPPRSAGQLFVGDASFLLTLIVLDPRPGLDRRRDQPRAREADARPADHDADLVARDRARQAPVGALSWILLLLAGLDPRRRRSCSRSAAWRRTTWSRATSILLVTAFVLRRGRPVRVGAREAHPGRDGHQPRDGDRADGRHRRSSSCSGSTMTGNSGFLPDRRRPGRRTRSSRSAAGRPRRCMWFNPFIAQVDVDVRHRDRLRRVVPDHRRRSRTTTATRSTTASSTAASGSPATATGRGAVVADGR